MVKGLSTLWTQNLQGQDKQDFEMIVRNSTRLLTRLKEILELRERELSQTSLTIKDFEDPNWSHKQAYKNGSLAVYNELKNLIPF